ncbi:helix-turn-helix domain-containing protein [Butyrivibrio sp. INlla14]|uniref:helix-turn-helix domain-containing protein n=1 Tax=Butyrivibrio sp. INlla14 TaxID=1520808 RepID=UPI00087721C6|nr:helix-turn-helix transcriptional regulator [Butyrivibrio sp. INlla14]SCY16006.1 Helix-turn-helix domain-containing protein [Butyrivibrio sp. INlla14]
METRNTETIGGRIRELREASGIGQKELAAEFFLSNKSVISAYERETRTLPIDVLLKYSERFRVSTDWILKGVDEVHVNTLQEAGVEEIEKLFSNLKSAEVRAVAVAQLKALALLDR